MTTKPKRGRPPMPAHRRRRHHLTFRVTSATRAALQAAARAEGRSMSEQIEYILNLHFLFAGRQS